MRLLKYVFFISIISIFSLSCEDDNSLKQPDISDSLVAIYYDDGNLSAPELPAGVFEAAVKFPQSVISTYSGKEISEIHFYIKDLPNVCKIKIYSSLSSQNAPSTLLYSENVISDVSAESWNLHVLNQSITIGSEDIWVAVAYEDNQTARTVGCDPGPASLNGDWLWDDAVGNWNPLNAVSSTSIDWNIRMAIDPNS